MSDLTELLERVKAATGPDRELDLALARALAPEVICSRFNRNTRETEPFVHWKYTSSIDAALTLVDRILPGWTHGYQKFPNDEVFNPGGYQFFVSEKMNPVEGGYASGESVSLPLAILVALLQAKLAQE